MRGLLSFVNHLSGEFWKKFSELIRSLILCIRLIFQLTRIELKYCGFYPAELVADFINSAKDTDFIKSAI